MIRFLRITAVGLLLMLSTCAAMASLPTSVKWSQSPDTNNGFGFSSEKRVPSVIADDWLCTDARPVTGISWWGAYWSPVTAGRYTQYSDGRPNAAFLDAQNPSIITGWKINVWSNVPAGGSEPYARPGTILKSWDITGNAGESLVGSASNGRNMYHYSVDISRDPFIQAAGTNIYWLSISAVIPELTANSNKQWGWFETGEHKDSVFQAAGQSNGSAVQDYTDNGWLLVQNNGYNNDMAFELTTTPEPGSLSVLGLGLMSMSGWVLRYRKRA